MTNEVVLRCACCGLPFAYVRDGVLYIESRHHGEKHVNAIPLVTVTDASQVVMASAPKEGAPK